MAGNWRCQTRQRARACAAGCRQRFESRDNTRFRRACRNYLQLRLRLQLVQIRCAYDWTIAQWITLSPPQCRTGWPKAPQLTPATGSGRPHDVRKGIIRRQAAGFSRFPVQRVGMRLRAASGVYIFIPLPAVTDCRRAAAPTPIGVAVDFVCMARHLSHAQRRVPHSAGQAAE